MRPEWTFAKDFLISRCESDIFPPASISEIDSPSNNNASSMSAVLTALWSVSTYYTTCVPRPKVLYYALEITFQ